MKKKIDTENLEIGMYVYELDRSWVETPFLFQGFTIVNERDIQQLRDNCRYVYIIEDQRGKSINAQLSEIADGKKTNVKQKKTKKVSSTKINKDEPEQLLLPTRHTTYEDSQPVEDEMKHAKHARAELECSISRIMQEIQLNNKFNLTDVKRSIGGMIESVLRNPNAFMWLTRLKNSDSYTYSHALDSSTLAIVFGRHLGLSKRELEDLALGLMLADIGKLKISKQLLCKPGRLTDDEFNEIKKHVDYSMEIARDTEGLAKRTLDIIQSHHERHNGSGYPHGLAGGEIPVFARIAAIVDCYDAITSDRPYNKAISQHNAVRKLYDWRNADFQEDLIEQFIQCLGVYPTGSLVELSSGQVGIILSQNRVRTLRPRVMLILDSEKIAYGIAPTIDLINETEDKNGKPLEIIRAIEPGAYGIDPSTFYL